MFHVKHRRHTLAASATCASWTQADVPDQVLREGQDPTAVRLCPAGAATRRGPMGPHRRTCSVAAALGLTPNRDETTNVRRASPRHVRPARGPHRADRSADDGAGGFFQPDIERPTGHGRSSASPSVSVRGDTIRDDRSQFAAWATGFRTAPRHPDRATRRRPHAVACQAPLRRAAPPSPPGDARPSARRSDQTSPTRRQPTRVVSRGTSGTNITSPQPTAPVTD